MWCSYREGLYREGLDGNAKQGLKICARLSGALDGLKRSVSLLVVSLNNNSAVPFDTSPSMVRNVPEVVQT